MINRLTYIKWLNKHRDKPIIKVVSGVRRSGKSTLFSLYKSQLLAQGILENQIISINFEDLDYYDYRDFKKLYQYISDQLTDQKTYIFLDEIQHVDQFELVVDSLFIKDNVDLYLTGSNAYFMSSDLATNLTGRYVELQILPLSFKEYYSAQPNTKNKTVEAFYQDYLMSSFPYTAHLTDKSEILDYLRGLYATILLNDVVNRLGISDIDSLERIFAFVLSNIGSTLSATNIANTLASNKSLVRDKKKTHVKTVNKYLQGLTDSLLLYRAQRYQIKDKKLLTTNQKYYVVDVGLRHLLLPQNSGDTGHILENIVYLELLRRNYQVYVGHIDDLEVDFYARKASGEINYIQVTESLLDEKTRTREFKSLLAIKDAFPKIILTRDRGLSGIDEKGIEVINVFDWLLEIS
ncbi:MAG: ATP-binding protein [Lactococcus sp.]|jgi:uncharacterized protein